MHYREVKSILSAKNGMNLFRGCLHGCIYCDSRSKCYQMQHDFEDIEIKSNALELLEQALIRKRHRCMIGTGSMTDPYLPLPEARIYTRRALELIAHYRFGLSILTKSADILQDIDLLEHIHRKAKCVVQMTLTTYDDTLCRIIEPGVCPTSERLAALRELHQRGIPTIVWLTPILPFINDTAQNIQGLLESCQQAGVYGIIHFGMGLTLREGNREYYYRQLDLHFPGLRRIYEQKYGLSYEIFSPYHRQLTQLFYKLCQKYDLETDQNVLFQYLQTYTSAPASRQLTFWN